MASTAVCGYSGSTSLGGEVTRWTFNRNEATPDATSMASSGAKEYIACLKDGDGDFDSLTPCGVIGSHDSVDFINGKNTITADIIITDITVGTPVDDKVTYKYTFVTTGPIS